MAFDCLEEDFQCIIDLSREYLWLDSQEYFAAPKHTLTLQSRILWPVYIVGTRCRNTFVRREAADSLDLSDCQQCPWQSDCIIRAIHSVAEIEESSLPDVRLCSDVPKEIRVTLVMGTLLGGDEYILLCNEKRDKAIRWLQIGYIWHGRAAESCKERRTHLTPWSRSSAVCFVWQDQAGECPDEPPRMERG